MLKVAILDDYQNVSQEFVDLEKLSGKYEFKIFSEPFADEADALDQLSEFEALLIMRERTPMTKNLIDNLTKLKFIITSGSRNKSIDLDAAKKRKIIVCGTEINFYPTSELTWALMLGLGTQAGRDAGEARDSRGAKEGHRGQAASGQGRGARFASTARRIEERRRDGPDIREDRFRTDQADVGVSPESQRGPAHLTGDGCASKAEGEARDRQSGASRAYREGAGTGRQDRRCSCTTGLPREVTD